MTAPLWIPAAQLTPKAHKDWRERRSLLQKMSRLHYYQIFLKHGPTVFRIFSEYSSTWRLICVPSCFSHVQLFVTLWTVAHQAPLSRGFSRQEYWTGLPCLPPEDLTNQGIKPVSLTSPVLAGRFFTTSASWETWQLQNNRLRSHFLREYVIWGWSQRKLKVLVI